jgi:hypothetical protein
MQRGHSDLCSILDSFSYYIIDNLLLIYYGSNDSSNDFRREVVQSPDSGKAQRDKIRSSPARASSSRACGELAHEP